jgi:hypothetical protein
VKIACSERLRGAGALISATFFLVAHACSKKIAKLKKISLVEINFVVLMGLIF